MWTFIRAVLVFCIFACLHGGVVFAQQEKQQGLPTQEKLEDMPIRLIAPAENTEVIGKRPDIQVEFIGQFENLLVMFDGTDVTQIIKKTENGFTYKPVMNLAPGAHTLKIIARNKEGKEIRKEFSFQVSTTKHLMKPLLKISCLLSLRLISANPVMAIQLRIRKWKAT